MKTVEQLTVVDLKEHPVWEYSVAGRTWVFPVTELPVDSLRNRLVGTQVRLASGVEAWALLSNISLDDPLVTQHFLTALIEKSGAWFGLARYFDVDYEKRGATQLATFLA